MYMFAVLWEDAAYKSQGNLFWPDFWSDKRTSEAQEIVHDIVGLKHPQAAVSWSLHLHLRVYSTAK